MATASTDFGTLADGVAETLSSTLSVAITATVSGSPVDEGAGAISWGSLVAMLLWKALRSPTVCLKVRLSGSKTELGLGTISGLSMKMVSPCLTPMT